MFGPKREPEAEKKITYMYIDIDKIIWFPSKSYIRLGNSDASQY